MLCCLPFELWDVIYNVVIEYDNGGTRLSPLTFGDPWNGTYIRYKTWLVRATKIVIIAQSSKTLHQQMNEYLMQYPDILVENLGMVFNFERNEKRSPLLNKLLYIKKNILQVYFRDVHFRLIEIMSELYSSYIDEYGDCDINTAVNICLPYSDTNVNRSFWIPIESWKYRDAILEYQIKKILNIT